jgi:hypothetical protein
MHPRRWPCNHCTRLQLECQFPTRKRSVRRRPRRQDELLGRLARLEEIVGKVDASALERITNATDAASSSTPDDDGEVDDDDFVVDAGQEARQQQPPQQQALPKTPSAKTKRSSRQTLLHGQADPSDPSARYMSRDFWSVLCKEVEGLKAALEQPSESDESDVEDGPGGDEESATPGSNLSSGYQPGGVSESPVSHALLSSPQSVGSEPLPHPSPEHISYLCAVYFLNVDLVMKFLHQPTIRRLFENFTNPSSNFVLDRGTEALFFAIYYGSVSSLSDKDCLEHLGEDRATALNRYRLALEVALGRADYLNSIQLEPLQAFVIYVVSCLFQSDGSLHTHICTGQNTPPSNHASPS